MQTVRQIQRLWNGRLYGRLFRELMAGRPDASLELDLQPGALAAPAAAMAIIRLDELCQPHVPLYEELLRAVLAAQETDGGWGEPMRTALCLRALMGSHGRGAAIERGLEYLASLQKQDGSWPREPLRRMPADAMASAFVLYHLGGSTRFREVVRFDDAVGWFKAQAAKLDADSRKSWDRASVRCRPVRLVGNEVGYFLSSGGTNRSEALSMQNRLPVGAGPSSNT